MGDLFMEKLLVICDSEITYARRMSEYITDVVGTELEVRVFTSPDTFVTTFGTSVIDILLVDETVNEALSLIEEFARITIKNTVILSKNPESNNLYKYQSAEVITKFLLNGIQAEKKIRKSNDLKDIKLKIKQQVQEQLLISGEGSDKDTLKVIDNCIDADNSGLTSVERSDLRNKIYYSIRGLDILEELIADESITEIMVNGENNIFYEKEGKLLESNKCFDSRQQLLDIIRKIASDANRTVNMTSPILDARLKNLYRANIVLEPISLEGPILTIRKFPSSPLTAEKLIRIGAISEEIVSFLRKIVYSGYNILISGSTGSGKTTFLNVLTSFIPKDERIITIEDSAELKIMGIKNLVRMESRNAGTDGTNEITIRDLIKSALRMRPDRIIVGEVRGEEAIDMLQSFTVGQEGSMSTIHANSAEDALYRLEMLMMIGNLNMPLDAIRRQISIGVDIIIQLGRLKGGNRKLLEISEVTGMIDDSIITNPLYRYEDGEFVKIGDMMKTYKLRKAGCL